MPSFCDVMYLGTPCSLEKVNEENEQAVLDPKGKIKGAAIEIKAIIEDYQMQAMGGLVPGNSLGTMGQGPYTLPLVWGWNFTGRC